MSAPILPLSCLQRPVFLVNSRQGPFTAAQECFRREALHPLGRSFSQSYGSILPSSLTRVLPLALVSSTRLPVSVCGTVPFSSLVSCFSRELPESLRSLPRRHASTSTSGLSYSYLQSTRLAPTLPIRGLTPTTLSQHPSKKGVQEFLPVVHRLRLSSSA